MAARYCLLIIHREDKRMLNKNHGQLQLEDYKSVNARTLREFGYQNRCDANTKNSPLGTC